MKSSFYLFLAIFSCIVIQNQNIFTQMEEDIASEVLGSCVEYFMQMNSISNEKSSDTDVRNEQSKDSFLNKYAQNAVPLIICNMGFEATGQYTHLLPQETQEKYIQLAKNQIGLGLE